MSLLLNSWAWANSRALSSRSLFNRSNYTEGGLYKLRNTRNNVEKLPVSASWIRQCSASEREKLQLCWLARVRSGQPEFHGRGAFVVSQSGSGQCNLRANTRARNILLQPFRIRIHRGPVVFELSPAPIPRRYSFAAASRSRSGSLPPATNEGKYIASRRTPCNQLDGDILQTAMLDSQPPILIRLCADERFPPHSKLQML